MEDHATSLRNPGEAEEKKGADKADDDGRGSLGEPDLKVREMVRRLIYNEDQAPRILHDLFLPRSSYLVTQPLGRASLLR
eukprot:46951-Eustigmatos_ZCMA.PRE.1